MRHGIGHPGFDQRVALEGRGQDSRAERLGEDEHVAGACARVGERAVGVHLADDHEPEQRLDHVDRVPAEHQAARALGHLRRVLETLGLERKPRNVTPDLKTYLREKYGEQACPTSS